MTLKLAPFCDDLKKYPQYLHTPPKILIFLKTPKNIEIQNFEPPKIARAYVCENIRVPPPPPATPGGQHRNSIGKAMSQVIEMETVTGIGIDFMEPEPDFAQNSFVRTTEKTSY